MYAMVDVAEKKKEGKLSSTSQKQAWHVPRKRKLSPKKVQDIQYKKYKTVVASENKEKIKSLFKTQDETVKSYVDEDFKCTVSEARLAERLKNCNIGWMTFFKEKTDNKIPILISPEYQFMDNVDLTEKQEVFTELFQSLCVTAEDCQLIEKLTRGQNQNELWYDARKQRLTSSNFGAILKLKPSTRPDNLLKDILGYRTFQSAYTNWGIKHEAAARRQYMNRTKNNVEQCGLIINSEYPYLGASPDGLIVDSDGIIEIKCPASEKWKMALPEDCARDKDFYCFLNDVDEICLKEEHHYYYQIQGQLAITKRKWCDFIIWTLKGLSVQRIFFKSDFWENMLSKLKFFYVTNVMPEILSSRVKRGKPLFN